MEELTRIKAVPMTKSYQLKIINIMNDIISEPLIVVCQDGCGRQVQRREAPEDWGRGV